MLSLSPRRGFFFYLNARIPSLPTCNVLNFLLFSFLCLRCSGITQGFPSRAPRRCKWSHSSISLESCSYSHTVESLALKTPYLVNIAWSPQRWGPQHGDQIQTPFGVHGTFSLALTLLNRYTVPKTLLGGLSPSSVLVVFLGSHCLQVLWRLLVLGAPREFSPLGSGGMTRCQGRCCIWHWKVLGFSFWLLFA